VIKSFDKNNLTTLRNDFDAAIRQVATKHGITIRMKTIRFDAVKASSTVEFIATGGADTNADPQAAQLAIYKADFQRYASVFGLKPEQWGATIKSGAESYKLVGLKPKAPKRPVLAQSLRDGRIYILTESAIVPLQSKSHKDANDFIFGTIKTVDGQCSNPNAYDAKWKPIGQCPRSPSTFRKNGLGKSARSLPYCTECARMIDESRAEMQAEARMS